MSVNKRLIPAVGVVAALSVSVILSPTPLAAQQDSAMMSHHSSMSHEESGMMAHDSGMMRHDNAMDGGSTMFTGSGGQKASGEYEIVESDGGKQRLNLKPGFAVPAAPELYLVLANGPSADGSALCLGKLESTTGAQAVDLPQGKDLTAYSTLLVWSKKEKRAVATAKWQVTSKRVTNAM
jgi:hypothetical protein